LGLFTQYIILIDDIIIIIIITSLAMALLNQSSAAPYIKANKMNNRKMTPKS